MNNNSIFITGGTGTIGQAIIQRSIQENWNGRITSYSRSELSRILLKRQYPQVNFAGGDIRDYDSLYRSMLGHDIVIHTAAQKHVSIGENEPSETIATNVLGTQNVLRAALEAGIKAVVNISTDKVCYPNNTYGMTKYLGEQLCREYAPALEQVGCKVVTCRFGNIYGSRGSVVDIWQEQLANGEIPTITNPDMTRFWIKPSQVAYTILLALSSESIDSGDIVVPELLGLSMEKFADYVLGTDIPFRVTGLRNGEKLHEVLVTSEEFRRAHYLTGTGLYTPHYIIKKDIISESKRDYTSFNARRMQKEELIAV